MPSHGTRRYKNHRQVIFFRQKISILSFYSNTTFFLCFLSLSTRMRSTAPERHLPSIALVLTQAAASGRSNRLRYHPYSQNPSSSANQDGHMVDPPLALRLCSVLSFL